MIVVSLVHSTVLSVPGFLSKSMVMEDFAATVSKFHPPTVLSVPDFLSKSMVMEDFAAIVSKFLPLALLFSMNEVFFWLLVLFQRLRSSPIADKPRIQFGRFCSPVYCELGWISNS